MITENLSTLKIHKLTQEQYDRELASGNIDEEALYIVPDVINEHNTASSTNTNEKIFLIGATSQIATSQTYSHDTAYVGTDGCLYSNNSKVLTENSKLTFTITGDGSATSFNFTHNKGTYDIFTEVYDSSYETTYPSIKRTGVNTVKVTFNTAPAKGETYTLVII